MAESTADILAAVLQLPPQERLELADALWSSVDGLELTPTIDNELAELVQQRCRELDSGEMVPISHDAVMARLNEALARCSSATTRLSPKN